MVITGVHTPLYTPEAEAVRAMLVDVLGLGAGWGIAVVKQLPGGVEMLLYQPRYNTAI